MPPQQRKEAESTLHTKQMPQTKRGCPSPATAAACAQPQHISVIHIAVHMNYTQTSPKLGLFQAVLNVASTNVFESSYCCQCLNVNLISLNGRHWSGYAIGANLSAGVAAMPDTLAVGLHPKPVKISQII